MNSTEIGKNFLEHFGTKGMRWGVRKPRNEGARVRAFGNKGKGKKPSAKDLSDQELREVLNRMQMEKQYSQLTSSSRTRAGADFAKSIALNVARTQITNAVTNQLSKAMASRRG